MVDGITLKKEIKYLSSNLVNNRIDKIHHTKEKLLILKLKNSINGKNRLIISVNPDFCSIHLTKKSFDNPEQPSTFCMSLRKHLEGGRIIEIYQDGYERLVDIKIENYNEIGLKTTKILHLELMGKYSNIILSEDNLIIDALYKYPIGVNGFREILPKRTYLKPPIVSKLNISKIDINSLEESLSSTSTKDTSLAIALQKNLQGFSKRSIFNLLKDNNLDDLTIGDLNRELVDRLYQLLKNISIENYEASNSLDDDIDNSFYQYLVNKEHKEVYNRLNNVIEKKIKKTNKKKHIYEAKIKDGENADEYRIKGELLSANLYKLKDNLSEVYLENYYDHNKEIKVTLNKKYSPSQNAKRYFKKYNKIKEGSKMSHNLLDETNDELSYLQSIKSSLDIAKTKDDFEDIADELRDIGLLRVNKRKKKKSKKPLIERIILDNGDTIYIGHNNKQNDYLTFKFAYNGDMWFHIKEAPGAHVILRKADNSKDFLEENILEAAKITAENSTTKGTKVNIDYTLKKFVKRHPSHNLGHAIYTREKTLTI